MEGQDQQQPTPQPEKPKKASGSLLLYYSFADAFLTIGTFFLIITMFEDGLGGVASLMIGMIALLIGYIILLPVAILYKGRVGKSFFSGIRGRLSLIPLFGIIVYTLYLVVTHLIIN